MTYYEFGPEQFECKCGCGASLMEPRFIRALVALRDGLGIPLKVTSGFRCDAYQDRVGRSSIYRPHTLGLAADFAIHGEDAMLLIAYGIELGLEGVGIKQSGPRDSRFVHLDNFKRPNGRAIWTY